MQERHTDNEINYAMLSIALVHHEAPCHMHTNTYIRTYKNGGTLIVRVRMVHDNENLCGSVEFRIFPLRAFANSCAVSCGFSARIHMDLCRKRWNAVLDYTLLKLTCPSTKSAAEMSSQEPVTVEAGPDGRHQQDNTFSSPGPNCAQSTHLITH